jgi:hypothetical protein
MFRLSSKAALAAVFMAAAVAGPAAASLTNDAGGGTATLIFSKGYQGSLGRGAAVAYSLSRDGKCDDFKPVGKPMSMLTGNSRTEKVAVDGPIVVLAATDYIYSSVSGGRTYMSTKFCGGVARFTPEAGRTYEIVHETPFDGKCRLTVTDKAAKASPPDLTFVDPKECKAQG